jgi:hypothetical protein
MPVPIASKRRTIQRRKEDAARFDSRPISKRAAASFVRRIAAIRAKRSVVDETENSVDFCFAALDIGVQRVKLPITDMTPVAYLRR